MSRPVGPERSAGLQVTSRRGDIQGLRAVAVLLVVVYHSGIGLPGGFIGVDVFFVISGYVITRMLTNELDRTDRVDLRRFYLRRIRRLLPALGLMLAIVMLASVLLTSIGGQALTARTGAAAALLNANTYLMRAGGGGYFDVSAELNALLHTWSLSVEEQFYLVFPALLFAAWAVGRRRPKLSSTNALTVILVVITVLSFLLGWATTNGYYGPLPIGGFVTEFAFYSSPTRAWEFAVGGLLALGATRVAGLSTAVSTLLAAAGGVLVATAAVVFNEQTPFPGTAALVPVIGTMLILAAGERTTPNPLNRALSIRPAQYLGDLSYSWYLWHWPLIVFAAALWPNASNTGIIAATVSLLPAWLSYRFVENRIRFAPRVPTGRTLVLAAACILIPVATGATLTAGNQLLQRNDSITAFEDAFRHHADWELGCDDASPTADANDPPCIWPVDDPIGLVVLVGDSNAGHFTEAVVGAANAEMLDARVETRSACPFVDLILIDSGETQDTCRSFVTETVQLLVELAPTRVVIASSSDGYIETNTTSVENPSTGVAFSSSDEKAREWVDGLARVIEPLEAAGIEVILVHPTPKLEEWDPRNCAVWRVLADPSACSASVTLPRADRYRARAVEAEVRAAELTSAETLDVAGHLCPGGQCETLQSGTWIWRDANHISVDAAVRLIPVFRQGF